MVQRKVQLTGGGTYTISLPKEWAEANGVEVGSMFDVRPQGTTLLVAPANRRPVRGELDISALAPVDLRWAIITMYENGVDEMVLSADPITAEQRRTVQRVTTELVGAELLEETRTRAVIKNILDTTSLPVADALTQIRSLALTMLEEVITAVIEGDADLARGVVERDDEVDRLWLFVARRLRSSLNSTSFEDDMDLPPHTRLDYNDTARQLERVADGAAEIGEFAAEVGDLRPDVEETLLSIRSTLVETVERVTDAMLTDDREQVRELVATGYRRTEEVDSQLRELDSETVAVDRGPALRRLVDALRRCTDYARNIGEIALHSAYPRA